MAQITAGATVTLTLEAGKVTVKVEDASKSDRFLAKVISSESSDYSPDQVREFERSVLE